jgi:putative FmdB family regulatory protein
MPLFDFKCTACEKVTEILVKRDEPLPTTCPHCKAENALRKELSAPSIELKGSGWYRDGYS